MIQLLINKLRMPSVIATISRSPNAVSSTIKRCFATKIPKPVENTLAKDVIIYTYENDRKFKILNLFAFSQLIFWSYLAQWSYTGIRDVKIDENKLNEDIAWWRKINLGEKKYKYSLTGLCLVLGYLGFFCGYMFTFRSIRLLVLRKDQKTVTIVTYGAFGRNHNLEVPLNHISAQESRSTAKNFLPLKIKNRIFYYILDMSGGEFKNTRLFDSVVGLQRNLK